MCNVLGLIWYILSWLEGDLCIIEFVDQVLLFGCVFVYGVQDCWQVCLDWYQREWGIEFLYFECVDGWWEWVDGLSFYEQQFEGVGFIWVDWLQCGDMIVMVVGCIVYLNYVGIYLVDDLLLFSEDVQYFGFGFFLLYYFYGRLLEIIVFGGLWFDWICFVLCYWDVK